jgi:hypothetical protein
LGIEEFFGVGVEPGAVPAGDVEEEKFGGEGVGGDVGFAEEMDALFQGSVDIEGVGFLIRQWSSFKRRV